MKGLLFAYVLGAFTFWPLVFLAYYIWSRPNVDNEPPAVTAPKPAKQKAYGPQKWFKLWDAGEEIPLDREGDAEAGCWVYLSTRFVRSGEPGDDFEGASQSQSGNDGNAEPNEKNARKSLQKIAGKSLFYTHKQPASPQAEKPMKSLSKLPKYWAVVRGGQLQLFEDQKEKRLYNFVLLPEFVVTLWPQDLQEFELFYKRYPICLVARSGREGLVTLDLSPGTPPRDALYLYVDNPTVKEDLYFALIKESKLRLPSTDPVANQLSLGPRDPIEMARPIRIPKSEIQELQSQIWSSSLPGEAKWLNALIGRLFFALKNSEWADEYLRRKFTYKLRPISASSGIIGDIEVRQIHSGTSPPLVHDVELQELTPDGNLVLSAKVKYTGSARVHLATMVKLSAVTSFTTAEIPIELAATLRHLEGTMIFRVKPAPSDRIWYAFKTMPDIDLQIEPVVYETQISLSVVTKYIKNRVVESLRESLVLPFMDDLSFYDTARSFYRGGIWEHATSSSQANDTPLNTQAAVPASAPASASASASAKQPPPEPVRPTTGTSASTSAASSIHPTLLRHRTNGSETSVDSTTEQTVGGGSASASGVTSSTASLAVPPEKEQQQQPDQSQQQSKVRKFSDWVKRKRSNRSLRQSVPEVSEEPESSSASIAASVAGSDTASLLSMSPGSARQRTSSTTQVTPANITSAHSGDTEDAQATDSQRSSHSPQRRPNQVRRKPVPGFEPRRLDSEYNTYSQTGMDSEQATDSVPRETSPNSLEDHSPPPGAANSHQERGFPVHSRRSSEGSMVSLDSPEKWHPTAILSKARPSLAESSMNASGISGDSTLSMNQELEEHEIRLRRSLSQTWGAKRPVASSSGSIMSRTSPGSRSLSPVQDTAYSRGHSRGPSLRSNPGMSFDQQSISSIGSSGSGSGNGSRRKQPTLPPRTRKYVPLTNVPPEHASN